jgi:HNH endonuclease
MFEQCIFCPSKIQLTDEHIVPEFMGGSLTFRAVCKTCNDKMGSDFEGIVANSLLFRLPRFSNAITGKSNTPVIPFPGDGITSKGLKVSLDEKMQPRLKPTISDIVNQGETSELSFTIDASDKDKLPKMVELKVRRYAKKTWPNLSKKAVEELVARAVADIPQNHVVQYERPKIHYEDSINLTALRLLYMKIAFEISVHHHGISYLADSCAIQLRDSINARDDEPTTHGPILICDDSLENILKTENAHIIAFTNNVCYIRLFNLAGIVQVAEENGKYELSEELWTVYLFDFKSLQCNQMRFIEYISNRFML